jgi:prepilin-type N-terminal cleavage/methylation domain-containing protein
MYGWSGQGSDAYVTACFQSTNNNKGGETMNRRNAGFTLIELIVVIAGVLGALTTLPAVQRVAETMIGR